jgi:hypothetical protein
MPITVVYIDSGSVRAATGTGSAVDELDDEQRGDAGLRQRQHDVLEEAQRSAPSMRAASPVLESRQEELAKRNVAVADAISGSVSPW